jgi:rod shape-determining protein MreB
MAYLRKNLAIDLGTTSILVFSRVKGVVLNEPSVVAVDTYTDEIVAVGQEAKEMLGRTPGNIVARRPLRDGVIADYKSTERMLKYFIHKASGKSLLGPDVIVCVPSQATQVQKRAVIQAASASGAHNIYLIEEPLAAAIGSGVDISDPGGRLICDVGGGTTDIALISLGGIVICKSIRVAGDGFDQAISRYIRDRYSMIIGERTAEEIKIAMGSPEMRDVEGKIEVKGRSISDGLPVHAFVTFEDFEEALAKPIKQIVDTVREVLAETPPELAADLFDRGILLTGGGSLIYGLDESIHEATGVEVVHVDHPISAVVRGTGRALSWINRLKPGDEILSESTRRQIVDRESLRKR